MPEAGYVIVASCGLARGRDSYPALTCPANDVRQPHGLMAFATRGKYSALEESADSLDPYGRA
jgi:hypothetical protein